MADETWWKVIFRDYKKMLSLLAILATVIFAVQMFSGFYFDKLDYTKADNKDYLESKSKIEIINGRTQSIESKFNDFEKKFDNFNTSYQNDFRELKTAILKQETKRKK
jgi:hypothetical protein